MRKNVFFGFWLRLAMAVAAAWFTLGIATAQETGIDTLYVMKNGTVTRTIALDKIDSLVFYRPNFDGEKSDTPEYVEINGVLWATRNVDQPGTFAASPESPGMFYQWNRKKAWSTTDEVTDWNSSYPTGTEWEKAKDPSPSGYRVPSLTEIQSLLDIDNVSNEWTTENGVNGRKFTDKNNGNSIFLPAVGYRFNGSGRLNGIGTNGNYWSSTVYEDYSNHAYELGIASNAVNWLGSYRNTGYSVRPVAETSFSIKFDKKGRFSSGDTVTGNIISSEEELTEVVVLKDEVVIATITRFDTLPVLKGESGVYRISLPDLATGSYGLTAKSATSEYSVKFELIETEELPEYVEINGVKWATRNIDEPGTFAANPESPGMLYQWNRKTAWSATGEITGWDSSIPSGDSWEAENDPSPAGYRVPTFTEIQSLLEDAKVSSEWTTVNGVTGRKFADKTTGNSIFLPAVGYRDDNDGKLNDVGVDGRYWSSMTNVHYESYAYSLMFLSSFANWTEYYRAGGLSVRPVAE
jgi:uncharacterized protein (TIGR02145 family)